MTETKNNNKLISIIANKIVKHAALHGKQAYLEMKHQVPATWNHYSKVAETTAQENNNTFDPSKV